MTWIGRLVEHRQELKVNLLMANEIATVAPLMRKQVVLVEGSMIVIDLSVGNFKRKQLPIWSVTR